MQALIYLGFREGLAWIGLALPRRVNLSCDTLKIIKKVYERDDSSEVRLAPENNQLGTLYNFFFQESLLNAHNAAADVEALVKVFCQPEVWRKWHTGRTIFAPAFSPSPASPEAPTIQAQDLNPIELFDDLVNESREEEISDDEIEDDDEEEGEEEETEHNKATDEGNDPLLGNTDPAISATNAEALQANHWHVNLPFKGVDNNAAFRNRLQERQNSWQPGLQLHITTVNSAERAFSVLWTKSIQKMIIKYTNEYGKWKLGSDWKEVSVSELEDFNMILLMSSIHGRKDPHLNWFGQEGLLNIPTFQGLMTGKRFAQILKCLHLCDLDANTKGDPAYKVRGFYRMLEERYWCCYEPDKDLSLDESLIWAFGRIGFKVHIITKSARYGICSLLPINWIRAEDNFLYGDKYGWVQGNWRPW